MCDYCNAAWDQYQNDVDGAWTIYQKTAQVGGGEIKGPAVGLIQTIAAPDPVVVVDPAVIVKDSSAVAEAVTSIEEVALNKSGKDPLASPNLVAPWADYEIARAAAWGQFVATRIQHPNH